MGPSGGGAGGQRSACCGGPAVASLHSHALRATGALDPAGATLRALRPELTGIQYEAGGHSRPDSLPALIGFATGIRFVDAGMTDCHTPLIAGAEGLPCAVGMQMNADSTLIRVGWVAVGRQPA